MKYFLFFSVDEFYNATQGFLSLVPKLMYQQVDEDLRLREQTTLVGASTPQKLFYINQFLFRDGPGDYVICLFFFAVLTQF